MNKKYGFKLLIAILVISTLLSGCGSKSVSAGTKTQTTQASNTQTDNSQIETYFTKRDGNLDKILIKEINSAQTELDVAIYSITKTEIANAIIDAKKRNVNVRVITDSECATNKYQKSILDLLKNNNIPIKKNSHSGLMHLKISVIDGKTVCGGSYNYTKQATEDNDENLLIIRVSDIVSQYVSEFNTMWDDTKNYSNY